MDLITTRFDATSTADEVVAGVDLAGTRALITGGGSGIGVETARSLARAGAEVVIAVRDTTTGHAVADDIEATTGRAVRVAHLDLLDRAGIMACPLARTPEGWEHQFATNHLGHFALTVGLHDALASAGGARVVSVSSSGHLGSPVVFDDLHFERRPYDPWAAYGQSKTANVLLAVEVTRRWFDDGIVANALMPGGIMTGLQKHVPQSTRDEWTERIRDGRFVPKTPQQGAATTLVAAVAPQFARTGGHYLEDCNEVETVANDAQVGRGVRRWAKDPDVAHLLWETSLELLATR